MVWCVAVWVMRWGLEGASCDGGCLALLPTATVTAPGHACKRHRFTPRSAHAYIHNHCSPPRSQGAALCRLSPDGNRIRCVHVPAIQVPVVSLIGAGDCLTAGFASCLARGTDDETLALAVGVVAASRVRDRSCAR